MKRTVLIIVTSMLLLLSIALALVTVQPLSTWAKGAHKKPQQTHHPIAKTTPTKTPTKVKPTPTKTTGGGGTTGNGGTTSPTAQLEQKLFAQINADRAAQGLPAYTLNTTLSNGARQHSVAMTQPGCGLSHQCPGEPNLAQRITNEGIQWMTCGENAGYTSPYPDAWTAVQQNIEGGMLKEQPPNDGHRKNLLSTAFHQIGIGIVIDSQGIVWVTEDFTN